MRTIILLLLCASLLLAACSAQPALPATVPAARSLQLAQATEAPAQPTQPPATVAPADPTQPPPAEAPAVAAGPTVYKIVPGESSVAYEVGETFFNQNNRFNLAKGVTTQVTGEVQVDPSNPQNSSIGPLSIDISQFKSDSSRRDNALRERFLQTAKFPVATFTASSLEGLPASYTPGQELSFQVTGDLTIRQVTRPVTWEVTARLDSDILTGTATTTILLSDFEAGPIQMAGILGTEDEAKLTLTFVARP